MKTFFIGLFLLGCSRIAAYQVSDHFNGKTFFNPAAPNVDKSFWEVMKWKFTSKAQSWDAPQSLQDPPLPPSPTEGVIVTWVNHSTFLIRSPQLTLLTDPIWSKRTSPVSFAGPARIRPAGLAWEKLPPIDVVSNCLT